MVGIAQTVTPAFLDLGPDRRESRPTMMQQGLRCVQLVALLLLLADANENGKCGADGNFLGCEATETDQYSGASPALVPKLALCGLCRFSASLCASFQSSPCLAVYVPVLPAYLFPHFSSPTLLVHLGSTHHTWTVQTTHFRSSQRNNPDPGSRARSECTLPPCSEEVGR